MIVGDPKRPTSIHVSNNVAIAKPDEAVEYLLCSACEYLLHHDETYAAEVAIQEDGTFPALAAAKVLHSFTLTERSESLTPRHCG